MKMLKVHRCLRCGYDWASRMERLPKVCPKCKSPYWNKQLWKGIGKLMDVDKLFIRMLQDLDIKLNSQDDYDKIKISGILRQLLIDAHPLADKVNRKKRIKISYIINDYPDWLLEPKNGLIINSAENLLDADLPGLKKIKVNKEKLLARRILVVDTHIYTVKDLILHVAHIQGGVHAGDAGNVKEQALKELAEVLSIGGMAAGLRMLSIVGRIIRNGLEPLRLAVLGR